MTSNSNGGELFIVDNSISGWTGQHYLAEWTVLSKRFDIATGYFEIGALLDLDGKWQHLEKIHILIGSETTARTKRILIQSMKARVSDKLNSSLEADKERNPFLNGVAAIAAALKSGQIECRIYNKDKFHAKAYITHAKLEIVGSKALVGSSNFTRPGLSQNIELNVQIQGGRDVAQLQEWFNHHWEQSEEITDDVLKLITKHTRDYTPFEVYAKAVHEYFQGSQLSAGEWEESESKVFKELDMYQKEGYWAAQKIANQHGGAFICDGVGLGKTFIGLMLIERLILHEGKRVMLLAPKSARSGVWDPHLKQYLPHIGGGSFSNLAVFNHTDLTRKGKFPEEFGRMKELADVIIIDEAHNFRNPGRRGSVEDGRDPSRYYRLLDILSPDMRKKTVYMLTATPINNSLRDFRHMTELFTRGDEAYFARTIGIPNLRGYFNGLENTLRNRIGNDAVDLNEHMNDAEEVLSSGLLFRNLVVQRSRAYARESQIRETGNAATFPQRMAPRVADYSIRKNYGRLLDMVEQAFHRQTPLFTLALYSPLHWYQGNEDIDAFEAGRQRQVVALIRTMFLKRFESSVAAFEISCDRLMKKLLAFLEIHSETPLEKDRLEHWMLSNSDILGYASARQLEFWDVDDDEAEGDMEEDVVPPELLEAVVKLDRDEYDVSEMMEETFIDLDQIVKFLEEARKFDPKHDNKLQKLLRLLNSKSLANQKILIFTEFADTARYLSRQATDAGIKDIEQVDSATKAENRGDVIKAFSPYYNGITSDHLSSDGKREIRILIATDVLSEGLNLQDASRMINYDIHWNPVRLMQRIGRVDRRINPKIEERLILDHPEVAESRGKVWFWNFLPPDELNQVLTLYTRVTQKTLLISKTLGIEERKLFTPDDDYDALKEFNQSYEGTKSALEEMRLEYQELLEKDPQLEGRLNAFPSGIFSGRKKISQGVQGVFFCYGLPALDKETGEFTHTAGTTRWYLYDIVTDKIIDEPSQIVSNVRSKLSTPRVCRTVPTTLMDIREKLRVYIKNTYLKRVDAPVGVTPVLKCWMELNDGG